LKQVNKSVISLVLNSFTNDSRVLKEAISLKKHGLKIKVVALHEKGLRENDLIEGIEVHRIKLKSRQWSKRRVVQLLKYIEFFYKVVTQYKDSNIIHCNDLNTLPIGVFMKKFMNKNIKIVYDSHEYQAHRAGISYFGSKLSFLLEKVLLPYCDHVIVVSESIAKAYSVDYGITKPEVVLNTPNFLTVKKNEYFRKLYNLSENDKIFLYQGKIAKFRGIEKLVKIFQSMPNKYHLVLMGPGGNFKNKLSIIQDKNIHIHSAVEPNKVLEFTVSADYGISLIEPISLSYKYCLPNKVFEYTMAGLPMIVSALPEMKKYVESNDIGIAVDFNDTIEHLAKKLEKFSKIDYKIYKTNLNNSAKKYNWEKQEKIFLKIYDELTYD